MAYTETAIPSGSIANASSMLALADQVEAGVRDVYAAWRYFLEGPMPDQESRADAIPPRVADRLAAAGSTLQEQVNLLSDLARMIRERA